MRIPLYNSRMNMIIRPYYQRVLFGFLPIVVFWLRFLFVFIVSIPVLLISDSLICEQLFGYSMFFSSRSRHDLFLRLQVPDQAVGPLLYQDAGAADR
ncbi:MAG: hypothetical protein PHQ23_16795 [Candidatus Wallbacteria bacterium]|nr:hypothetical protein [Candidatus Wallbacteria bacterium]